MSLIILFASILIEGETKNLSYNPALFKTHRECKSYLSKENDLVFETLENHIKKFYPDGTILYVDCAKRSDFQDQNGFV